MANNCLVTKLKGVVQNDNLPKLGELVVKAEKSSELQILNPAGCTIYSDDILFNVLTPQGSTLENVSSHIVPANDPEVTIVTTGDNVQGTLRVTNKYGATILKFNKTITDGAKYCPAVVLGFFGDASFELKDYVNPDTLVRLDNYDMNAIGTLYDLGACIHLTFLCTATTFFDNVLRAVIDGDWLRFISMQIGNGRTTGQITGAWSALLFNGERLSNDANYKLDWEPSGANYLVTYISGEDLSSPTTTKSVTIDAAGNVIS